MSELKTKYTNLFNPEKCVLEHDTHYLKYDEPEKSIIFYTLEAKNCWMKYAEKIIRNKIIIQTPFINLTKCKIPTIDGKFRMTDLDRSYFWINLNDYQNLIEFFFKPLDKYFSKKAGYSNIIKIDEKYGQRIKVHFDATYTQVEIINDDGKISSVVVKNVTDMENILKSDYVLCNKSAQFELEIDKMNCAIINGKSMSNLHIKCNKITIYEYK